jgi:hypothetical protein
MARLKNGGASILETQKGVPRIPLLSQRFMGRRGSLLHPGGREATMLAMGSRMASVVGKKTSRRTWNPVFAALFAPPTPPATTRCSSPNEPHGAARRKVAMSAPVRGECYPFEIQLYGSRRRRTALGTG